MTCEWCDIIVAIIKQVFFIDERAGLYTGVSSSRKSFSEARKVRAKTETQVRTLSCFNVSFYTAPIKSRAMDIKTTEVKRPLLKPPKVRKRGDHVYPAALNL